MKKLVLALTAVAVFTGSAVAADLPARAYTKAPVMPEPVYNWTGFYVFGGAGGGVWDADSYSVNAAGNAATISQRLGGDGWFGTVGAGYDWQFSQSWVAGIFADGQFGSLRGSLNDNLNGLTGIEKLRDTWAAGVRLGYLVAPNVYSYVNAGFTQSYWSGSQLGTVTGTAPTAATGSFDSNGWFIGGGVENNLNIFGITAPGWFMKTEYRAAYFDRSTLAESNLATGLLTGNSVSFHPLVQTVSTSLVYRFNWGGPVVAKY
ncbi:porin family protein [Bradyrhizobium sp.]|uniref:outer membrane protein n=1 Tax=Bradyrhizobium sp. TaxID=376 RepID=UPI002613A30E|nr:porin family protein [Bradyrhizobium sp.]